MEIHGNLVDALRNDTIYRLQLLILMDKLWEQNYYLLEENYWWCVARREVILSLISKFKLSKKHIFWILAVQLDVSFKNLLRRVSKTFMG